jgi:hypothetical protein
MIARPDGVLVLVMAGFGRLRRTLDRVDRVKGRQLIADEQRLHDPLHPRLDQPGGQVVQVRPPGQDEPFL